MAAICGRVLPRPVMARDDYAVDERLRNAINATPGHTMLFSALRHAAFTSDSGVLFVHAAVNPMRPLAAQGDAFWWGAYDILDLD